MKNLGTIIVLSFYGVCIVHSKLPEPSIPLIGKNNDTDEALMTMWNGEQNSIAPSRRKRSVFHLFNMMTCATTCNPLDYKGYGCYCGFLGSGVVVDGIDKCCKGHDWCYEHSRCKGFDHYFAPYKWKCNDGRPLCVARKGPAGGEGSCGHQLCECDREFVMCLQQHPCPKTRAMCMTSPWRYWQNVFMGMSTGTGMHNNHNHNHNHNQDKPPQPPQSEYLNEAI